MHRVERFVEKPDAATASAYLADGRYLWNSGNFLASAAVLSAEIARLAPTIDEAARTALAAATRDLDFERLEPAAFGHVRTTGPLVAALGVADLMIVATPDAVLVADAHRAQDVKAVVERLRAEGRGEADGHPEVHRPWGSYRTLDHGPGFQVKQIRVNPGGRLSLQSHRHRAEHWVVIEGTARVTRGPNRDALETVDLPINRSIDIPLGWVHRLENTTEEPVAIVEVQSGGYLGEDDIERYDDAYGRG